MKDAYYFSHDSNAKDDPKCVLLIDQLGMEGYGIFWVLIETLREQPEYRYPLNLIPALARRYCTTAEKMNTVVRNYNLFIIEDNKIFFSESLVQRMLPLKEKRDKARMAANVRWGKCDGIAEALQTHSECNASAMLSKVKDSKVNNDISSDSVESDVYAFEKFWDDYDKKIGSKTKLQKKWNKLSNADKLKIKEYIPRYKVAQPDKQYRKNPETFLNNQSWNDELIKKGEIHEESRKRYELL